MALNSYILSCALIVWNTFGFRSLGILGCEGENNHGCDKRHHVVNVLGQSQMGEDGGVRNVCQGTEYRKEYGCSGNVERFPLTEDHNSEGKESGTGYADFEVPGGNGRNDVGKSADTAECTGDDNTGVSPLVYVDTNRVGCLWMLTAGTQAQSPFRFEEEHVAADQKDDADEQEDVHGKWSDLVNESGVGVVQLCGSCTVSGIRAVVECFYQDDGNGSSQHVQRGSADRLVCFQCDGGEAKQQRVDHTGYGARQNGKCHKCRSREVREQNQDEDTGKAADRHDSFQRDVDDTASLGEHTAHRNEHQNNSVQ